MAKKYVVISLQDSAGDLPIGEYDSAMNKIAYYKGMGVSKAVDRALCSLAYLRWEQEKDGRHPPVLFTFNYAEEVYPLMESSA